jgi:hypothetical protein
MTIRVTFQDKGFVNRADLVFSGCTEAVALELAALMWPQAITIGVI